MIQKITQNIGNFWTVNLIMHAKIVNQSSDFPIRRTGSYRHKKALNVTLTTDCLSYHRTDLRILWHLSDLIFFRFLMLTTPTISGKRQYVFGRPPSVVRPLTPVSRDAIYIFLLSERGISAKLATNIRHASGHCWKCFQRQRSKVKVMCTFPADPSTYCRPSGGGMPITVWCRGSIVFLLALCVYTTNAAWYCLQSRLSVCLSVML